MRYTAAMQRCPNRPVRLSTSRNPRPLIPLQIPDPDPPPGPGMQAVTYRRPIPGSLGLPQRVDPLSARQQPGGLGGPRGPAGGYGQGERGGSSVVGSGIDNQHVVLAKRIATHEYFGPHILEGFRDRSDAIPRYLEQARNRLRGIASLVHIQRHKAALQ